MEVPMTTPLVHLEGLPLILHTRPVLDLSDEQFYEFCQLNREWRIERTTEGDLVFMAPAGGETGYRNILLATSLATWALPDGTGVPFDSSTGFTLPNGAIRSPDVAWVKRSRLASLTPEQKRKFLPLCPDFVIELRSPSDNLKTVQDKMREYLDNGTLLGWLIDPVDRRVYVYRPGAAMECLDNPVTVSGDPELPSFVLDLKAIWETSF
jgi:Uma2 family endonuclease